MIKQLMIVFKIINININNNVKNEMQVACHDFSATSTSSTLTRLDVLTLLIFILLHVFNLLSIVNIFVQLLFINLCTLHS